MVRLIFELSCLLLAVYLTKGETESPFIGGVPESDIDTWYELQYDVVRETVYDSTPILDDTSTIEELGWELKYQFDQIQLTDNQSSLAAGKILFLAEEFMKNDSIKEDPGTSEVINNIIQKSSLFARKLSTSFACHGVSAIKYATLGEYIDEENNEYILFYNPDGPEKISKAKIVANPGGDKMMITIERKHRLDRVVFRYSILIDNADYPADIQLIADKTSRKIVSLEETTDEEICAMEPIPSARICIPMTKLFGMNYTELAKVAESRPMIIKNHIKICK